MTEHSDKADPIGFIGLGLMGAVMARRLAAAGFKTLGFDIEPAKATALRELGLEPAGSVADIAPRCPRIILAVVSIAQVDDGTDPVATAGHAGRPLIACCARHR